MSAKVYVDGQEGTTGLRIHEYLAARRDIEVLRIEGEKRKDVEERTRLLNAADVAILCLPDAASREAVGLVENATTRVIDASTAFRTDPAWAYGLPELEKGQREKIRATTRVAVPGCHASAFILAVHPLVTAGIVSREAVLTCFSLTGYSGAGRKMIAAYEESGPLPEKMRGPRHYALTMMHKHLPEMQKIAGLAHAPLFSPVICNVHSGLAVEVFLPTGVLGKRVGPAEVREALAKQYAGERFVRVGPLEPEAFTDQGYLDITSCNGTNRAEVFVVGHGEQMAVIVRLDNLGKGAAGAAVQCLNLMLGVDEGRGLSA